MSTAEAFLRDIRERPEDDTPRLVFADWLEDNGDPRRAEFIRLQCRLAALGEDAVAPELLDRQWELLAVYQPRWQPEERLRDCTFRRGFLARAVVDASVLLECGDELFRSFPLEELHIRKVGNQLREIAQQPWLTRLSGLDLSENALALPDLQELLHALESGRLTRLTLRNVTLNPEGLDLLLNWPGLRRLTHLEFSNANLGDRGRSLQNRPGAGWLRRLLESPHLGELTFLSLHDSSEPDADLDLIANHPRLGSLTHLHAVNCGLTVEGMRALSVARGLPALRHLKVGWNSFGDEGNAILAGSPLPARLETLDVSTTGKFGPRAAAALAASPHLGRLRRLDLTQCDVGEEAAKVLAAAPFGSLVELRLFSGRIGPQGMAALARSPHLAGLRRLDLLGNHIGPEGLKALLGSPLVTELHSLDLCANQIGLDEAKLLAGSSSLAKLRYLGLGHNDFGARGARVLLESPHLSGLWGLDLSDSNFTDKTARLVAASTTLTELRRLMVGGLYSYRVFTDKGRHMLAASPRLPHLLQIFGHGGLWPPAGKVSTIVLEQGKGREL
jgi:uncharacterized protein (TIGR02996 family)